MLHEDPRALLGEVRSILEAADGRELSPVECARCDALLDAAEALGRLGYLEAGHLEAAALSFLATSTHDKRLAAETLLSIRGANAARSDLRALLERMRGAQ